VGPFKRKEKATTKRKKRKPSRRGGGKTKKKKAKPYENTLKLCGILPKCSKKRGGRTRRKKKNNNPVPNLGKKKKRGFEEPGEKAATLGERGEKGGIAGQKASWGEHAIEIKKNTAMGRRGGIVTGKQKQNCRTG